MPFEVYSAHVFNNSFGRVQFPKGPKCPVYLSTADDGKFKLCQTCPPVPDEPCTPCGSWGVGEQCYAKNAGPDGKIGGGNCN